MIKIFLPCILMSNKVFIAICLIPGADEYFLVDSGIHIIVRVQSCGESISSSFVQNFDGNWCSSSQFESHVSLKKCY